MPRILWALYGERPIIEVLLVPAAGGSTLARRLVADTGAGTARAGFELFLHENDCLQFGGFASHSVSLGGAYLGTFPVHVIRIQIPGLGFDHNLRAVAVPACPPGFDGIAAFRLLNRLTFGNFGDSSKFGLEM